MRPPSPRAVCSAAVRVLWPAIDCDASAFVLQNGKLTDKKDIVYFGNLKHYTGTVQHMGDNLTGAGEGDDEQIVVDLARVPAEYDRIVLVVNIYQAVQRRQHFGMIQNAFIRIVDAGTTRRCAATTSPRTTTT